MHIYAFGSICRGDVTPGSDIDLLAITDGDDPRFDLATYSRYSYARLRALWQEGNPFAWHLSLESRLLFAEDNMDFLGSLGPPHAYQRVVADCDKFARLFRTARAAISAGTNSIVFELSTIFLAIRNIATCFSLGFIQCADFSRRSALHLGSQSLSIDPVVFEALERARVLSTRGVGEGISDDELPRITASFGGIEAWMNALCAQTRSRERVQQ
jgi:hypothetical protein